MGCLFGCFRPRGTDRRGTNHLVSSSIPSARKINQDSFVPKRQLGSLFLNEDHDPPKQFRCSSGKEINDKDSLYGELKREAEFLKTCGAVLQTPPEIRKTSARVAVQDPANDGASSNCVSEISDTNYKKILWDEKYELSRCPDLSQSNYGSSSPQYQQVMQHRKCSSPSASLSKSLGFEGVQIESVIESKLGCHTPDISLFQHESHTQRFASKCSPITTPLKVEEMETPATVYPSNLENPRTRKDTMVPAQYVYRVLNPAENLKRKVLNEDSLEPLQTCGSFDHRPDYIPDSRENIQQMSQISEPEDTELSATPVLISLSGKRKQKDEIIYTDKYVSEKTSIILATPSKSRDKKMFGIEHPEHVITSLSEKPPDANDVYNEIKDKSYSNKSSDVDRPILGMVAAHWKDEEPEHKSPKQWDGNGIPNSTNKYKEDQKVSWHATPFEERLEKALSNENFLPKRKFHYGKPLEFEGELADTAAS